MLKTGCYRIGSTMIELVVACALISILATATVRSIRSQRLLLEAAERRQCLVTLAEDHLNRLLAEESSMGLASQWQLSEMDDTLAKALGDSKMQQRSIETSLGERVQVRISMDDSSDVVLSSYRGLGS